MKGRRRASSGDRRRRAWRRRFTVASPTRAAAAASPSHFLRCGGRSSGHVAGRGANPSKKAQPWPSGAFPSSARRRRSRRRRRPHPRPADGERHRRRARGPPARGRAQRRRQPGVGADAGRSGRSSATAARAWEATQGEGKDRKTVTERRDFKLSATPATLDVKGDVAIEPRYRGIFKVNGYVLKARLVAAWNDGATLVPEAQHPARACTATRR